MVCVPVARVIRHHWHGQNWLAWLISLKNYQHSLDSYYIVCGFAGGRIAARCSVQIGRTGSDPAGISHPGSIPLERFCGRKRLGVCLPQGSLYLFLPANSVHQFVGIVSVSTEIEDET